ncbi:MAG: pirin family protein [Nitriliruptoraceae bacterium]
MSGPIASFDEKCENDTFVRAEAREGRRAEVGGLPVARVLPTKGRRTVGAWCFVDLAGPADAEEPDPLEVGPHPHIGLATVTWLLEGEALHSDSLGTEQVIRPGQLNLMAAGHGIAHAELAAQPPFRAVQMWIAQPQETRHGDSWFEHHGELPQFDLPNGSGMVLVGSAGGVSSPATTDTPLVGIDLQLRRGVAEVDATASFEYAVVPLDGTIKVGDDIVEPGWIGLIPCGYQSLPIEAASASKRHGHRGCLPSRRRSMQNCPRITII